MQPVEAILARIAARQFGLVTWRQMLAAGIGRGAIELRIRRGQLHRVHRGVYLVGHAAMPVHAREFAAVLACGDGAVLSHRTASAEWALLPPVGDDVDVTVAGRNPGSEPGIRLHRARILDPRDVTELNGMPITTVARTLLDQAEVGEFRLLERAFDEAITRHLTTTRALQQLIDRSPGRRGGASLSRLIRRASGSKLSRSDLEEMMLALIRAAGLPEPELNILLLGRYKVDFLWREFRLVIESDGGRYHASAKRRTADARRDSDLRAEGWKVERVTDYELEHEPHAVIARVSRALYAAA